MNVCVNLSLTFIIPGFAIQEEGNQTIDD